MHLCCLSLSRHCLSGSLRLFSPPFLWHVPAAAQQPQQLKELNIENFIFLFSFAFTFDVLSPLA